MNQKGGPNYANALWQAKGAGFQVTYEDIGEGLFEIVYKISYTMYAQQTVIAKRGMDANDFKEAKSEKSYRSGIKLRKDSDGNYISEKYEFQMNKSGNDE